MKPITTYKTEVITILGESLMWHTLFSLFLIILPIAHQYEDAKPLCLIMKDDRCMLMYTDGDQKPLDFRIISFTKGNNQLWPVKIIQNSEDTASWAVMKHTGELMFSIDALHLDAPSEGLARVEVQDENNHPRTGYIDTTGKYIINPEYLTGRSFSEGLAFVVNKDWAGYIDLNGKIRILLPQGWSGENFLGDRAVIKDNGGNVALIDKKGNFVLEARKSEFYFSERGPVIVVQPEIATSQPGHTAIYTRNGTLLNRFQGIFFKSPLKDGMAVAHDMSGSYGMADSLGQWIIPARFQQLAGYHEGMAPARSLQGWGFIDRYGKWVIKPVYNKVRPFQDGLAYFSDSTNSTNGYLNLDGEEIYRFKNKDLVDLRHPTEL